MDSIIRRLKINHLKTLIEIRRLECEEAAKDFERLDSLAQKAATAGKWDELVKDIHKMRLALDLLESEESNAQDRPDAPPRIN